MIRSCDEFERRLQHCFDARQDPLRHEDLKHHAEDCRDCAESMAWQRSLVRVAQHAAAPDRHRAAGGARRCANAWVACVAACLVLSAMLGAGTLLNRWLAPEAGPVTVSAIAHPNARLADAEWWKDWRAMATAKWSTTPGFRLSESVRGGIEPLRSSFSSTLSVLRRTWPHGNGRSKPVDPTTKAHLPSV